MLSARSSLIINRRPQEVEKGCQKVGHDSDQKGKTKVAENIFRHEVHVSEPDHYHTEKTLIHVLKSVINKSSKYGLR